MSFDEAETFRLARTFEASPGALWAAWTDAAQFAKWFNPAPGFDLRVTEWDASPGGACRFTMPQPDGTEPAVDGVFHALDPFRELVQGTADRAFMIRVRFEPEGAGTRMSVAVIGLSPEHHEGAVKGWNACFENLAAFLAA